MSKAPIFAGLGTLSLVLTLAGPARAQCAGWDARFEYQPGFDQRIYATAEFDDGSGPALYAGGEFTHYGSASVGTLARWNGTEWSEVGGGVVGRVLALAVYDDGSGPALYVAGDITSVGGSLHVAAIAKWDGSTWSALGSGLMHFGSGPEVSALAVFDDGSGPALYAGGVFDHTDTMTLSNIARWNGASWSTPGSGANGEVDSLAVFDDGTGPSLYAGGVFTFAGGVFVNRIARWNGSSWSMLGTGMDGAVNALAVHDDGGGPALYAGGGFLHAGGAAAACIAKWNGASWSPLGSGLAGSVAVVRALDSFDDGSGPALYAGGTFTQAGSIAAKDLARWKGASWSALAGEVNDQVRGLSVFDDGLGPKLIAVGDFLGAGTAAADRIAAWNGSTWSELGTHGGLGLNAPAQALIAFDDGHGTALFAGGSFMHAGDVQCNTVAKWKGGHWSALGDGLVNMYDAQHVSAFAPYDDGQGPALYAAGRFSNSGTTVALGIAKWDGTSWSPLGSGAFDVSALAAYDDGSGSALYAGGLFTQIGGVNASHIAKWNGSSWSTVGGGIDAGLLNSSVNALAVFDAGSGLEIYAGGNFGNAGGTSAPHIARWNGTSWSPVGSGTDDIVWTLAVFDDGTGAALYAGGAFMQANGIPVNHIARWDGRDWSPLGAGFDDTVLALCTFDDGSGPALIAAGWFTHTGAVSVNHVAKWNGVSWSAFSGGVGATASEPASALAVFDDGSGGHADLYVGGTFTSADGTASNDIAQWHDCFPGAPFCFGDGSTLVACPCSNVGQIGHGCENSAATGGAVLRTIGTTQPDTLVLTASSELPHALSIFLQGDAKLANGAPFGDGVRCAGGHLRRLYAKNASSGNASAPGPGDPSISARSAALGDPIPSGATRYYQTYYRDPNLAFCPAPAGDSWNVTNGVQVQW